MKILDPGHTYELSAGSVLNFIHKDGNRVVHDGTTIEEVLGVLIDRVTEAYQAVPCEESVHALFLLKEALATFRMRTARRIRARVEGTTRPHCASGAREAARSYAAGKSGIGALSHRPKTAGEAS